MATICNECGGIVPDIMLNGKDRNDCKNHRKIRPDIKIDFDGKKFV